MFTPSLFATVNPSSMAQAPVRYAEPNIEDTMGQSIKTQLSDSVRKLSKLSRQVSGVAATDLTPRERGDLIAELQSLATTFDTLAAHATGEEMLDTAREGRTRVEAALAELELGPPHKSNRKITLPWATESLYPVPNIQNHGTRNLGIILSGGAELGEPTPEAGKTTLRPWNQT